jgi:hypothetical protein
MTEEMYSISENFTYLRYFKNTFLKEGYFVRECRETLWVHDRWSQFGPVTNSYRISNVWKVSSRETAGVNIISSDQRSRYMILLHSLSKK